MLHNDEKIDDLIDREKWKEARRVIQAELKKKRGHHWLLDRLSLTYYEEHDYKAALGFIVRAFRKLPTCPLVLWDYAGTLDALGESRDAIGIYEQIVSRSVVDLAHGECGEGLEWAKALVADCIYRIGVCYRNLDDITSASKYLRDYLLMRKNGSGGIYDPKEIEKELESLQPERVVRNGEKRKRRTGTVHFEGHQILDQKATIRKNLEKDRPNGRRGSKLGALKRK